MDKITAARLEQYIKWAEDLNLDYDKYRNKVDDPNYLVQISRDGLQEQIDKDIAVFTEEDLNKIKETDLFILDNIEQASRWLSPDSSMPKASWWWHLDKIKTGDMPRPDINNIFTAYLTVI